MMPDGLLRVVLIGAVILLLSSAVLGWVYG